MVVCRSEKKSVENGQKENSEELSELVTTTAKDGIDTITVFD